MKKAERIRNRLLAGVIALILGLGIFGWGFTQASLVSHAESQAKVTAPKGANIRKEASASSAMVGGAENGKVLTVISQVQGADGNFDYQGMLKAVDENVAGHWFIFKEWMKGIIRLLAGV